MAECRQEPSPAVFNGDALTAGRTIFNRVHFFQAHKTTPVPLTSFVSNLHWPAFKAVSGSLAQKMLEESWSAAGCPVKDLKFPARLSQISRLQNAKKKKIRQKNV